MVYIIGDIQNRNVEKLNGLLVVRLQVPQIHVPTHAKMGFPTSMLTARLM